MFRVSLDIACYMFNSYILIYIPLSSFIPCSFAYTYSNVVCGLGRSTGLEKLVEVHAVVRGQGLQQMDLPRLELGS